MMNRVKLIWLFAGIMLMQQAFPRIKKIGLPHIKNYSKKMYGAGTQNWGIAQDQRGFIYFANNDGILRFDGINWDLLEVPCTSPVRSITVDKENHIFIGLFNDFGILEKSGLEEYKYKSLRYLLPKNQKNFGEIWRIHDTRQGIVFQSHEYAFIYQDNEIKVIEPRIRFQASFNVNGRLLLHEPGIGLFEYFNHTIAKVPWAEPLKEKDIRTILQRRENQLLIGTVGSGFYKYDRGKLEKWETPASKFVEKNKLFSSVKIFDKYFAFGTILNGVVIADEDGIIVQQLSRNTGLQNNTILSLFSDKDKNLWLGLDNGIDYVEINSPVSFFGDLEGIGTGYCCQVHKGNLYFGTNQGVYVKPFDTFMNNDQLFELVKNTEGQCWTLQIVDGQLLCGHNAGTFIINDKVATKIYGESGAWKYIPLKKHPELVIGGHYNGLVLFRIGEKGLEFLRKIKGFTESCRFLDEDEYENIWVSHGEKGVFKVQLNEDMDSVINQKLYNSKQGLPFDAHNIILAYNKNWYVSAFTGIYKYNYKKDIFFRDSETDKFGINSRLKIIETDKDNGVWFIAQNEAGVLRQNEDLTYTKITAPFKQLIGRFVNEFEFIYPFNNEHVFIGLDNGFAHYSSKLPKTYMKTFKSFITNVEIPYLDTTLFLHQINSKTGLKLPFRENAFRFHYIAPFFESLEKLEFSYLLENYSEEWSSWSKDSYKDFTNLREGDYVFNVKAKNAYGTESEVSQFQFTIKPPWHRSSVAYYVFAALILIVGFGLLKIILHRIEVSKKKEKLKYKEKLKKQEEEFRLQAVVAEKVHRDKELANQTMNVIQKNRLLNKLTDELNQILSATNDSTLITKLVVIKKRIKKALDDKQQSKLFDTYFDDVHSEFFKRLKEKYPQLSPKDLRLSAFIKMNIPTKEIAMLLNISDRGVEMSRYRLRKKMNISRDINLSTYLSNI